MSLQRRRALPWLAAAFAFVASVAAPQTLLAQSKEVHIYNWSDYIDPTILEDFTKETGIKVVYDVFDSNEILETKLLAGKTGYDVVVPTATFLNRQIKAKVFAPLDKSKLPNLKNMWPQISERVAAYDPDNSYSINYMWGTTGIGYDAAKIKERMADAPTDSWRLAFDPDAVKNFKDCGVMFLDSPEDLLPSVMVYLGLKPEWTTDNIQKAADHLAKLKPFVRKFHSSEYINALANGDICLAVGYSGDMLQARDRAEEAAKGVEVSYVIPKEGAQLWFDQMAIPADSKNKENALIFLDYMMRPEVIAKASDFVNYANGNLASQQFVDKKVLDDPGIYPPADVMQRLFTVATVSDSKTQRAITRAWTKAKSGR
jgi:putrescine transport system substrate-binding protein